MPKAAYLGQRTEASMILFASFLPYLPYNISLMYPWVMHRSGSSVALWGNEYVLA